MAPEEDGRATAEQATISEADPSTLGPAAEWPPQPPTDAVEAWIFLNPGGAYSLPHVHEGEPVDVMFTFDNTHPGGPSWRDRLVSAVRTCCPVRVEPISEFDDQPFEIFSVPPLVVAWLEWLTDDGSFNIAMVTERDATWRIVR